MASPKDPHLFLAPIIRVITHNPIIGNAKSSILNLSQMSATSQPVIVIPTFAPNISHKEFEKVKIPAFTNPIANKVVTVDDCIIAVTKKPERNHFSFVSVHRSKIFVSMGHDADFNPSDMMNIPSKNKPIHQSNTPKDVPSIIRVLICVNRLA